METVRAAAGEPCGHEPSPIAVHWCLRNGSPPTACSRWLRLAGRAEGPARGSAAACALTPARCSTRGGGAVGWRPLVMATTCDQMRRPAAARSKPRAASHSFCSTCRRPGKPPRRGNSIATNSAAGPVPRTTRRQSPAARLTQVMHRLRSRAPCVGLDLPCRGSPRQLAEMCSWPCGADWTSPRARSASEVRGRQRRHRPSGGEAARGFCFTWCPSVPSAPIDKLSGSPAAGQLPLRPASPPGNSGRPALAARFRSLRSAGTPGRPGRARRDAKTATRMLPAGFDPERLADDPLAELGRRVFRRHPRRLSPAQRRACTIGSAGRWPRAGCGACCFAAMCGATYGTRSGGECREWSPVPVLEIDVATTNQRPGPRLAGRWRPFWKCSDERLALPHHPRRVGQPLRPTPRGGLCEPDYGGPLRRHVDRRRSAPPLSATGQLAGRAAAVELPPHRRGPLAQRCREGKKIVGTMKDLGTVPVMAYALPNLVAFYPDGAWWLPCIMEDHTKLLEIADSLGIDESFCPVAGNAGGLRQRSPFSHPGHADLQRRRRLRRFLGHRPTAGRHGASRSSGGRCRIAGRPTPASRPSTLPGGFRGPGVPSGIRQARVAARAAKPWHAYAGARR